MNNSATATIADIAITNEISNNKTSETNDFFLGQEPTDPSDFSLSLPDPHDQELAEGQFLAEVDRAWQVCDRFDPADLHE